MKEYFNLFLEHVNNKLGNRLFLILSAVVMAFTASWITVEPLEPKLFFLIFFFYFSFLVCLIYIFSPRTEGFFEFLCKIKLEKVESIELICHTGSKTCDDLIRYINEYRGTINPGLELKILLRDPNVETSLRKTSIETTVIKLQTLKNIKNLNLRIKYYTSLPWLRYLKTSENDFFINHYYYFKGSKTISYTDKEFQLPSNRLKNVSSSWFNYYWGKSIKKLNIHTLIFDFDDTITKTYEVQISSWCSIIESILNENPLNIPKNKLKAKYISNSTLANRDEVTKTFFIKQNAVGICKELFISIADDQQKRIQDQRYEIRRKQFTIANESLLFENVKNIIAELSENYYLSIISSTDSELIKRYLENVFVQTNSGLRKLDSFFEHIIGRNDPVIEMTELSAKAKRLIKFSHTLGIPHSRLLYIGDSLEDFEACKQTNINFLEARLNVNLLQQHINKTSLIDKVYGVNHFEKWDELPSKINIIEQNWR